jgi:hypothetical protein
MGAKQIAQTRQHIFPGVHPAPAASWLANRFLREIGRDVALRPLLGHSRIDTTQLYTDEIEVDELAAALAQAFEARNAQTSPDLATLEAAVAAALQDLQWRRRESNPRKISIA